MKPRIVLLPLAALAVMTLAGCLSLKADMTVNSDGTATGDFTVEIAAQAAGFMGITSSEALVEQAKSGQIDGAESASDLACEPVERSGAIAMTCSFSDQAFTSSDDLWNIEATGDAIIFKAKQEQQEGLEENPFVAGLDAGGYDFNVRMPGPILSIEGERVEKVSDDSFRISATLTEPFDVTVTSEKGSSQSTVMPIIGIVVVVILAILILLFVKSRRSKASAQVEVVLPETLE